MTGGMGCFAHPQKQGVAQCKRCGKVMCRECSSFGSHLGEKHIGLCKICILQVGIECAYHSSEQATTQCSKCGRFICSNCCDDDAWNSGSIGSSTYCYNCMGKYVDLVVSEMDDFRKEAHANTMLMKFFSVGGAAVGAIIGIIAIIAAFLKGENVEFVAKAIWFPLILAWMGAGIGGILRVFLSMLYFLIFVNFKKSIKEEGLIEGLKIWFFGGLIWGLISYYVFVMIGFWTGPIIPLYYIKKRRNQIKVVDDMIERNTNLAQVLKGGSFGHSNSASQIAIHKEIYAFVESESVIRKFDKKILWVLI